MLLSWASAEKNAGCVCVGVCACVRNVILNSTCEVWRHWQFRKRSPTAPIPVLRVVTCSNWMNCWEMFVILFILYFNLFFFKTPPAQVTTVSYMHQSQRSSHLLRINFTVPPRALTWQSLDSVPCHFHSSCHLETDRTSAAEQTIATQSPTTEGNHRPRLKQSSTRVSSRN